MPKVPESVTKEQYLLKSTFFYNKLKQHGYFDLFMKVQKLDNVEGCRLDWSKREQWSISKDAWKVLLDSKISPMLVFAHPKVLKMYPSFLKYYRSVAMLPQKGLKAISRVSNVDAVESGKIETATLGDDKAMALVKSINEVLSLVVELSAGLSPDEIQGMMYATAGTNIDGSWRNQIGAEGERVIRSIILKELHAHGEVSSITFNKTNKVSAAGECDVPSLLSDMDTVKAINLINGYSVLFSSEPDVTLYDAEGGIAGIIEIKSGLDPAGALERLGAMFKSFENTLAEYPEAVTILVASCITDEVSSRLNASMVVRQTYITTKITSSDAEKRKFVNRLRVIMKLTKKAF